ncbi:MAG: hypothetical protein ACRD29_09685 [Acidimicrobiales bacterium]
MTKSAPSRKCRWCGRRFAVSGGRGRPRLFCGQPCRQWSYVAAIRAREAGLTEQELIIARAELDALYDQLYVLECAIDDAERDLRESPTKREYQDALAWVVEAAKPLVRLRLGESRRLP